MTQQPTQRNHYADHLAEVNKTNTVRTTDDIRNENGAVIVPKGTEITPDISNKIARFKLSQPLETQVNLENIITPAKLHKELAAISKIISHDEKAMTEIAPKLVEQCKLYGNYPLLTQKLTVLSERLPGIYRNSLITSNTALIIAHHMGLDAKTTHAIFIAAQMHDSGLLNISPDIVNKKGKYEPTEWKTMQGHVAIGRVFLEMVPKIPKVAAKAVFEHHERLDGTGYPLGKSEEQLCLEGQVIAIADTINAIYMQRLRPSGYSIKDLVPVLQMNSHVHPKPIHDAALRALLSSTMSPTRAVNDEQIPELINFLLVLQKILLHWFKLAMKFTLKLRSFDKTPQIAKAFLMIERLHATIQQSGLFSEGMTDWLNRVLKTGDSKEFQEVEYSALMFDEFCYQLQQLHKLMQLAVSGLDEAMEKECFELSLLLKDIPKNRLNISASKRKPVTKVSMDSVVLPDTDLADI